MLPALSSAMSSAHVRLLALACPPSARPPPAIVVTTDVVEAAAGTPSVNASPVRAMATKTEADGRRMIISPREARPKVPAKRLDYKSIGRRGSPRYAPRGAPRIRDLYAVHRVHHWRAGALRATRARPDAALAHHRHRPGRQRDRFRDRGGNRRAQCRLLGRFRELLRRGRGRRDLPTLRPEAPALGQGRLSLPRARLRRRPVSRAPEAGGDRPGPDRGPAAVRRAPGEAADAAAVTD